MNSGGFWRAPTFYEVNATVLIFVFVLFCIVLYCYCILEEI